MMNLHYINHYKKNNFLNKTLGARTVKLLVKMSQFKKGLHCKDYIVFLN